MMYSHKMSIEINGKGPTQDQAIGNAIGSIKNTVFKELEQLIVRIEPSQIVVIKAVMSERKERFMFILFPRIKRTFIIRLRVEVDLILLDTKAITWTTE